MQRESRLDKATEDELWKRFSHARTTFDRKRRQHFGALDEQRSHARAVKERLIARAEELSASTDWAGTSNAFRDLMTEWKAAGRTARKEDDALWARFRAAQDTFFAARTAAHEETEAEFRGNLALKEALLEEAERLVPVRDAQAARAALRDIQDRWEAAGKVPRADLGRVEARLARRRAGGAGRRAGAVDPQQSAGPGARPGRGGPARVDHRHACASGWTRHERAVASGPSGMPRPPCRLVRSGWSRPAARWLISGAEEVALVHSRRRTPRRPQARSSGSRGRGLPRPDSACAADPRPPLVRAALSRGTTWPLPGSPRGLPAGGARRPARGPAGRARAVDRAGHLHPAVDGPAPGGTAAAARGRCRAVSRHGRLALRRGPGSCARRPGAATGARAAPRAAACACTAAVRPAGSLGRRCPTIP